MRLKSRVLIIVVAALVGMSVMALGGLVQLRQSMLAERRAQIAQLLRFANAQLAHYQGQEAAGLFSREEAQARAREAIGALREGDNYFIVRDVSDGGRLLVHGTPSMIGKKTPEGLKVTENYLAEVRNSQEGRGYVMLDALRPNSDGKTRYKKLNGVTVFEPWNWLVVIGFFVDDIEQAFWSDAARMLIVGGILIGIVALLAMRTMRSILSQLGGEPSYAAEIVREIANGNLSRPIRPETAGEESLLGSMRVMQEGLHGMVSRFNQASTTVADASHQLSEETGRISDGSRKISEATASTAAAIEEMTVSINHISDNARATEENSQEAADLASQGEQLAREAASEIQRTSTDIDATAALIRGLVERSREIDGMSAVIKDISDQTNLLALNAAIEAARAGEQGRGFAVVADEVRKLAERTGRATGDITSTIRAVQSDTDAAAERMDGVRRQVASGVALAEKAALALHRISGGAHATLAKTRDVANAAREQSEASNSIAINVENIARMVDAAEGSVEAAHAQVRQLDSLAKELSQAAAKFRL